MTVGARALGVALIGLTFIYINKNNYGWFGGAAAVCGFVMIGLIVWFDHVRRAHICKVPLLNRDGTQQRGWFGSPKFEMVVIGSESNMRSQAAESTSNSAHSRSAGSSDWPPLSGPGGMLV